ncbi:hypothetical protein [Streptomyces sp. B1I3]|uniref:hypothetical protein n=1 Tax=Streptomyces sp. B1I3 TaxID=3042264 RepID=UPI0027806360|nr:hypothetical protein [Streptomyces sp. B1I3]MDQ0792002.1 hypothetical protein [Streptomyces sp. B1I3]
MGYASYEITRNGQTIRAGYSVETTCEKTGCDEKIDRGLGNLCGQTPGGDEHGCGGYFCGQHLLGDNRCESCADAATKANTWVDPATGEEFDLRDRFLPPGTRYDAQLPVWVHRGDYKDGVPLLTAVVGPDVRPAGARPRPITDGEWEDVARVAHRQMMETRPGAATAQG